MEKGLQLTSKLMLQKCSKPKFFFGDRISQLPDDILVIILSFLKMKEAACTSILSHRWKNLWTFITTLDFDAWKVLSEIRQMQLQRQIQIEVQVDELWKERSKYVSWVNQILNSHNGRTIDKFRVSFDLNFINGSDIDKWIKFAIQKRVRWLEVDLQQVHFDWLMMEYPFPAQIFENPNISFLTALNLNYVDARGEILEYLLSNCPCLEILRVSNSPYLIDLKVFGASLKLKYLEITHCPNMKFLEISAVNLTSLTYTGRSIRLCLKNVPNLAVVSFGGDYCDHAIYNFSNLSNSLLSQIEILTLDLTLKKFFYFSETSKFRNLKQLELIMMTNDDHHMLLSCTKFLKACPLLYRFTLELKWFGRRAQIRGGLEGKKVEGKKLKCLKVLELRGFRGRTADVELAMYLFKKAVCLEKVTVDTRTPVDTRLSLDVVVPPKYLEDRTIQDMLGFSQYVVENKDLTNRETQAAKECATQLVKELCPQAELLLIP